MNSGSQWRSRSLIITAIHGTFARNAEWIQAESEFQRALQSRLARSALFRTFQWSGANSHASRKKAGVELSEHLRCLSREHPGCAHILIAHSHGGNVACYALKDDEIRSSVALIITLGTPFVLCRRRRVDHPAKWMATIAADFLVALTLAVCVAAFVVGYTAPLLYPSWTSALWYDPGALLIFLLALAPAWYLFLVLTAKLPDRLLEWVERRQSRIEEGFCMPWLRGVEILSIGAERDEAGALLGRLHRWANVPSHLFAFLARLFRATQFGSDFAEGDGSRLLYALVKVLVYAFFLVMAATYIGGAYVLVEENWYRLPHLLTGDADEIAFPALVLILGFALSIFLLVTFLSLFIQVLMLLVPPVVRAHRLGFGEESPFDNWLADIHTADDPSQIFDRGKCIYREIPAAVLGAYRHKARLRHSQLYCAVRVVEVIAEHVNRNLWLSDSVSDGHSFR